MIWRILAIPLVCSALQVHAQNPELKPEIAVSASIGAEKVDRYSISAGASQIIHIVCKSPGGHPGISLFGPAGRRVFNNPMGNGMRSLTTDYYWLAPAAGPYRLEIQGAAYLDAPLGYELTLEAPHEPAPADKARMEGDRLLFSARDANIQKRFAEAANLYEQAFAQYELTGDRAAQSAALREMELFEANSRNDFRKSIALDEKAISISTPDDDPWGLGILQNAIGYYQFRLNEFERALATLKIALDTRRKAGDVPGQAQALGNIGHALRRLSRLPEAAEAFLKGVELYRKAKDLGGERDMVGFQALAEHEQGRFHEEISFLDRTLALAQASKAGRRFEGDILYRKADALISLNRQKDAVEPFQAAAAAYHEANAPVALGNVLHDLGRAYWSFDDVPNAKSSFERALSVRRTVNNPSAVSQTLTNLASLLNREDGAYDQADKLLGEALELATSAHDEVNRSYAFLIFGEVSVRRKEFERATEYFRQSVTSANTSKMVRQMAYAHQALARELSRLQRFDEAVPEYESAVSQFQQAVMPLLKAATLVELGRTYASINRPDRAQEQYSAALAVRRDLKDRSGEADTLNAIGVAHRFVNEYDKAIESFSAALSIYKSSNNVTAQAATLNYLGMTYGMIGSKRAIECFREALALLRPLGHSRLEVSLLNNLGYRYDYMGDGKRAAAYLEEAVAVSAGLRGRVVTSRQYYNLAHALRTAGDATRSAETAKQALAIARRDGDKYSEWKSLLELARSQRQLGAKDEAAENLSQALSIAQQSADSSYAAKVWSEMGAWSQAQGDFRKAVTAFENAAAGYRLARNRQEEAEMLSSLSAVWKASGQLRVAVVYGKQTVNTLQSVRTNVDALEEDVQASFLANNERHYRDLADLLISLGRLPEAREVLELLKVAEYREFVGRDEAQPTGGGRTLAFTPEEREFTDRYAQIAGQYVSLGRRRSELLAKMQRSAAEEAELAKLDRDIEAGNAVFQKGLDTMAASFAAKPEAAIRMNIIRESEAFKEGLAELQHGAVIIYTLVANDRYRAILTTPAVQKSYEYAVNSAALAKKIFDFREALQNPRSNPLPLARELYTILVGPELAEDLRQAEAKTLIWSLDGVLRYVPLAALNDGTKYMVESYDQVIFTPASYSRWKDPPKSEWKAAGFGVTKAHENFPALPGVASELGSIIGPILPGRALVDEAFTTEAMRVLLRQGFPVVHLASHFKFEPGSKSSSYLLMGDGSHLTVAEMERMNSLFSGVDLITLSACNTGVGDLDSDGREVEGLGTLAQWKGAKAVVASLWPVADASTGSFMEHFYRWRKAHPESTKVEALRRAQLALLQSTAGTAATGAGNRGVATKVAPSTSYAHPYFWAPFFLMGNWL